MHTFSTTVVGVDILVTHDAPFGIFDSTGGGNWGSSQQLLSAIYRSKAWGIAEGSGRNGTRKSMMIKWGIAEGRWIIKWDPFFWRGDET